VSSSASHPKSQVALFLVFFVVYGICLFLLLPHLSLWLDELLNVIGAEKATMSLLLDYVAHNSGGVPLGYWTQRFCIDLFGFSEFSARVPSACSSLAAVIGIFLLAYRLKARFPALPATLFCMVPLQWRYAIEARPYSMALALTIWSTVIFFQLVEKPQIKMALLYSVVVLAGLYTNPYALFVSMAHVLWLFQPSSRSKIKTVLALAVISNAFAVALFLPWYLHVRHLWAMDVPTNNGTGVLKLLELILKELVGGGYVGSVLVLALATIGVKHLLATYRDAAYLLIFWLAAGVVFPLVGNALFHYFFAARQLIFALAPLALLAGFGIEAMWTQNKKAAIVLASSLTIIFLFNDVNLFLKPRENWRSAAATLKQLSVDGTCLIFVPADSLNLYRVFDSTLTDDNCLSHLADYHELAIAISPYAPKTAVRSSSKVLPQPFQKERELNLVGPIIRLYRQRQH
jgi:4-amino-4-deoxy-L-arabinose transferase-like glycosyltransferase